MIYTDKSLMLKSKVKSQKSKFRGFTLVELLVVITLLSTMGLSSIFVFSSYSKSQAIKTGTADFLDLVNKARARAISQVKPSDCGVRSLEGYEIWVPVPGTYSRLSVRCGGIYYILERRNLPPNVTFATGTTSTTFFNIATGNIAAARTYIITGSGNTKTVKIDTIGNVSVQ